MNGDDEKIWALYAKGVTPLGKQEPQPKKKQPVPAQTIESTQPASPQETIFNVVQPTERYQDPSEIELDRRVEQNLRQGDVIIEARLDMHGMTLQEAHEALGAFIAKQARLHRRLVLVVTGKGREGEATLRNKLPRWCAELLFAQHILALRPAAPHHGGGGAWYVMLRKLKTGAP